MSDSKETRVTGGLGLSSTLFLIFLVLKMTDNIDWSWAWVTSPLWIGALLTVSAVSVVSKARTP